MKQYKRIMLGSKSMFAEKCYNEGFIGVDYQIREDLTNQFTDNWREFNKKFIPIWQSLHPDKKKVAAGLACGTLWTLGKGINSGDAVLCPDGKGNFYVGEVSGGYFYKLNEILPHRREVIWSKTVVQKSELSSELQRSMSALGTISDITRFSDEIEKILGNNPIRTIISTDETVEDPSVFALEKHLEEFLVQNWNNTVLGKDYEIYQVDGEIVGQQYPTDTGAIDILAISKDKKSLLVVELKKGRASDVVVGQIQRYMGYVKEELAESNQKVQGIIIALEDDNRIKRALSVANSIKFYKYQVSFKLYQ